MAAATPQHFKGSVILLEHARKMQAARDEKHRKEIAMKLYYSGGATTLMKHSWG